MESIRRAESTLSISSIVSDSNPNNEDSEIKSKTTPMLKLLLEAVAEANSENATLGNEISEMLRTFKLDLKSLPADIREGMQTTSVILKSEGLPTVDETTLKLCLESKKIQSKMKEREERLLKAKYNAAFAKYNALQERLNCIRKGIEQIEDTLQVKFSNDENAESNRILWSNKLHEYRGTIETLEDELDTLHSREVGLDQTLQKSTLLMDKLSDLTQLNEALEQYGDLPPNLLQAKHVLECKRKELEEIENSISDKLNS